MFNSPLSFRHSFSSNMWEVLITLDWYYRQMLLYSHPYWSSFRILLLKSAERELRAQSLVAQEQPYVFESRIHILPTCQCRQFGLISCWTYPLCSGFSIRCLF